MPPLCEKLSRGMRRDQGFVRYLPGGGTHPDDRNRIHQQVQSVLRDGGGHYAAEYRTVGMGDGVERWLSAYGRAFFDDLGTPQRLVGVTLDVTERKRLEDQFRQAQKLESIGRVAGGVAHDFNNLLTVISGYASMLLEDLAAEHPCRDPMEEIARAAARGTGLTRHLLTFSRKQVSQPKNFLLNDLLRDMEKMMRRLIGEDIELVLRLDSRTASFAPIP